MVLENFQKLRLLEEYKRIQETGDPASISELANWAEEKFRLKMLPSKATIQRIIRNETKNNNDLENQIFKGRRGNEVKFPEFEHFNSKSSINSGIFWNGFINLIHTLEAREIEKQF